MAHPSSRSRAKDPPSAVAGAAAELLEVLRARGQDAAAPAVSPSQLRAMLVVEKAEGINLRSLGAVLGSRPPSVTRLCDRLEAMGLLQRSPSPTSRREVELRLTGRGRVLLDEHRAIRLRELSAVLDRMEPDVVEALIVGLTGFMEAAAELFAADPEARISAGDPALRETASEISDSA
ncbi:MarR family transcriptional regulator [Streptomyces sp. NPDC003038]|uniref:MarR family winged helix-turn-helix transcriptional regulator n=1 Tax=unclassified Streptomyces TaxID=2593676 RepID=UPI0033B4FF89